MHGFIFGKARYKSSSCDEDDGVFGEYHGARMEGEWIGGKRGLRRRQQQHPREDWPRKWHVAPLYALLGPSPSCLSDRTGTGKKLM